MFKVYRNKVLVASCRFPEDAVTLADGRPDAQVKFAGRVVWGRSGDGAAPDLGTVKARVYMHQHEAYLRHHRGA